MIRETYEEFNGRLDGFEKPEYGVKGNFLKPNNSVFDKVNTKNLFKPFFGDTVVFDLQSFIKERLSTIISELYAKAPECFCERIVESTMHMTLHDLSNSVHIENAAADVRKNEAKIRQIQKNIRVPKIAMKTNFVIDMNHTSLVFALKPLDEAEYQKLMELYYLFDEVRTLSYKLTPHVTLAYYNRNGFNKDSIEKLSGLVRELNDRYYFEFVLGELLYQRFTSMNHYETVIKLS